MSRDGLYRRLMRAYDTHDAHADAVPGVVS
jgi:hypothetical protein